MEKRKTLRRIETKTSELVSLEMDQIPRPFDLAQGRLQAKRRFVMPAKAGIQIRIRVKSQNLD